MSRKLLLSVFLIVGALSSYGQMVHNNISGDAAVLSLGGVRASSGATAFSINNNMAATSFSSSKLEAGVSYTSFQPSLTDATILSFGAYYRLSDRLTAGLSYSNETLPSQDKFNDLAEVIGDFKPKGMSLGLAVSYLINSSFSVGFNLKNSSVDIDELTENNILADLSLYHNSKNLRAGLTVNNLGANSDLIIAPMNMLIAGEYDFYSSGASLLTSHIQLGYIFPQDYSSLIAGLGLEYSYDSKYFLQAGYSYGDDTKYMTDYASVGLGVDFSSFTLNAAYLINSKDLGNSLSISLNIRIINL